MSRSVVFFSPDELVFIRMLINRAGIFKVSNARKCLVFGSPTL